LLMRFIDGTNLEGIRRFAREFIDQGREHYPPGVSDSSRRAGLLTCLRRFQST
jgi:hypothetical protein